MVDRLRDRGVEDIGEEVSPAPADRVVQILTLAFIILTVLVLLCYAIIFIAPQVPLNPFPPPTLPVVARAATPTPAKPTPTPYPTFPPTWTPTATATPTNTPTPTATSTNTPTPTNTPRPTPRPTPTPTPLPYQATVTTGPNTHPYYSHLGCGWFGIWGYIKDANNQPVHGVIAKVTWGDEGPNETLYSKASGYDGYYEVYLGPEPRNGTWYVQLFEGGVAVSPKLKIETIANCNATLVTIHWTRRY